MKRQTGVSNKDVVQTLLYLPQHLLPVPLKFMVLKVLWSSASFKLPSDTLFFYPRVTLVTICIMTNLISHKVN